MTTLRSRVPVAVLGATGLVGQRLISLLAEHPWFELSEVAASERSAGRPYRDAVSWRLPGPIPAAAASLVVRPTAAAAIESRVVFSALDASVALEVEAELAARGAAVISNAKSHRLTADVPLLVPEANAVHLDLIDAQKRRHGSGGYIVTNPNCSVIAFVLALAPLARVRNLTRAVVTTLQAASGAGYPGVPALDLIDNVIPFIGGEEEKIETEPRKIFGRVAGGRIEDSSFVVSAHVHRVPVSDGHTLAVSLATDEPLSAGEAAQLLREFRAEPQERGLPSAPTEPVVVVSGDDRPQPRLDRMIGAGMSAVVGKIRSCPSLGLKFEVLSHNTVRGAAGGTLLIAELLAARGVLP